jgi:hypothetical protein
MQDLPQQPRIRLDLPSHRRAISAAGWSSCLLDVPQAMRMARCCFGGGGAAAWKFLRRTGVIYAASMVLLCALWASATLLDHPGTGRRILNRMPLKSLAPLVRLTPADAGVAVVFPIEDSHHSHGLKHIPDTGNWLQVGRSLIIGVRSLPSLRGANRCAYGAHLWFNGQRQG